MELDSCLTVNEDKKTQGIVDPTEGIKWNLARTAKLILLCKTMLEDLKWLWLEKSFILGQRHGEQKQQFLPPN